MKFETKKYVGCSLARQDKYQHHIKEYWVDTETSGSLENENEESLIDRTSTQGEAASINLGLPASIGLQDQVQPEDSDLELSGTEAGSIRSRHVPNPKDVEKEHLYEARF